ncbi:nickel transporter [Pantoea sp. S61]|uniref:nickel/cobalt transporter n=1 Tax=Pantoea sp. S61 TaxID=2767442 RepID=UPI00190C2B09|nr:nickel transporter [Pantoea sp. S61]MBK0122471.1 nickel transporter [Pantoea sp. S61]MBK0122820.1 nickel transporter [Pantoea sp. S61]
MTATKTGFTLAALAIVAALAVLFSHWTAFLAWSLQTQIQLHRLLVTHLLQINSGQYSAGLWLIGVTFIYGILHAVGPGHGKFIVTTWLTTHQPPRGVALSVPFLGSLVQGLSAIAFVFILAIGFNLTTGDLSTSRWYLEKASALFIAALGVMMMVQAWRGRSQHRHTHQYQLRHEPKHEHEHEHEHEQHHAGCGHHHGITLESVDNWKAWIGIIIATGVRPCSGALTVLLFASVIGITRWGMFAVMTMALGTGMALVALALFVRHFRHRAGELWLAESSPRTQQILGMIRIAGGALLILFALVLFLTVVPISANGDYIAAGC